MLHYLFAIFHWNACITYFLSSYLSNDLMLRHVSQTAYSPTGGSNGGNSFFAYQDAPSTSGAASAASAGGRSSSRLFQSYEYNNLGISSRFSGGSGHFFMKNNDAVLVEDQSIHFLATTSSTSTRRSLKTGQEAAGKDVDLLREYLKAFYMCTKIMTLVSEIPNPRTSRDYLFAIVQLVLALMLFATIMGHVGYIVINLGNARKEFQCKR